MSPNDNKTYSPKPGDLTRDWHVIDASDVVLGRLAVQVATLLRGKHKPTFAPHMDGGDFVVVVNASKISLGGSKGTDKMYHRHSGRPGGLKSIPAGELLARDPRKVVELAVWGMLPKNRLSRQLIKKLKVYSGPEHPHTAQQPQAFAITQSPSSTQPAVAPTAPPSFEDTPERDRHRHRDRPHHRG